jgi:hypothetical protein
MVMPQVPALFLPKKSGENKKTQSKEPTKKNDKKKSGSNKKVSALLKGRVDGYKENNGQIYRTAG